MQVCIQQHTDIQKPASHSTLALKAPHAHQWCFWQHGHHNELWAVPLDDRCCRGCAKHVRQVHTHLQVTGQTQGQTQIQSCSGRSTSLCALLPWGPAWRTVRSLAHGQELLRQSCAAFIRRQASQQTLQACLSSCLRVTRVLLLLLPLPLLLLLLLLLPLTRGSLTLMADMAAKKGAPVYSLQPPMTPTLPDCPLYESSVGGVRCRVWGVLVALGWGAVKQGTDV